MNKNVLIVTALAGFIRSFLENDIKILQEKGYRVFCVANIDHPGNEGLEDYFNELGVEFIDVKFSSNKPFSKQTYKAYKDIKKIIKENNFELIHVHTPIAAIVTKFAAKKARKKGCKIIYTVHGFYFHKKSSFKTKLVFKNVEKLTAKMVDMIITINKEDYSAAKKMDYPAVRYISGVGVKTEKFINIDVDRKEYRKKLGIAEDEIMVLSIGELSYRKNHRIIIEALAKLKGNYVYVICGNDMNKAGTSEMLKALAKEKNVKLKLMGLRKDVPQICKCADIGAFPSSREGLGLAGIEMLASGLPIVASNVQGIKDYLIDGVTGFSFDADDAEGFSKGIKKLSDVDVRNDMIANCQKIAKKFDYKISDKQMRGIYNSVLLTEDSKTILHYSLGMFPYRTGGMTKFCNDLIIREKEAGNRVILLWPGKIKVFGKKLDIKKHSINDGIENYEILNPLPVSLNGGINNIPAYTEKCADTSNFIEFIKEINPDAIHLHTLMGIHKELIEIASEMGIKIIYTTHDYFGICPKITMFRKGKACECADTCEHCPECNQKSLGLFKVKLLQSSTYQKYKSMNILRWIRGRIKESFFNENKKPKHGIKTNVDDYIELKKYYNEIFKLVDQFHFNSEMSKTMFEKYLGDDISGKVIKAFHNDVYDNRRKIKPGKTIRLGYMSRTMESKGYKFLIDVLKELWEENERWFELNIFEDKISDYEFVNNHWRYSYENIDNAYSKIDVLVVPSLWNETFGLVVLEAISYGIPVIVTKNVGGMKIIEHSEFGKIINIDKEELKETILSLKDGKVIETYNDNILKADLTFDFNENVLEIMRLYE